MGDWVREKKDYLNPQKVFALPKCLPEEEACVLVHCYYNGQWKVCPGKTKQPALEEQFRRADSPYICKYELSIPETEYKNQNNWNS